MPKLPWRSASLAVRAEETLPVADEPLLAEMKKQSALLEKILAKLPPAATPPEKGKG